MSKLRRFLIDFKNDKQGMVLEVLLTIVFIVATSIIGLIGALITNEVADALRPLIAGNTPALGVVQSALTAYIVGIVFCDICLLIWCEVSAQKKESQEYPNQGVFY